MANFQKMTLIVAGILLLVCIVVIVLIFLFPNTEQVWPPMVPNCPDYFKDINGDGSKCQNDLLLGTCGIDPSNNFINFTDVKYIGSNSACEKYNTAQNCQISWDGITYGVKNPCTNNNS